MKKIPTYTSLMESINIKEKHMIMFSFQTAPTSTSLSTRRECLGHLEPPIEDMSQTPKDPES